MADETRDDVTDDAQTDDTQADDAQSDRPKWLLDELQHYLPGVDITTMPDSEVAAALKKYVDKFYLGQYGDLIDDPTLNDTLERDAAKQGLGQYADLIDDPDLRGTLEREAEKQRLGDFADLVDDPGLKDALEKEAERQRLGDNGPDLAIPTGADADDPMNPHNTQQGEPPRTKTPEQRMDERLDEKLSAGRPSPGSGTSSGPSMAPSSGNTPGGASGQTGTSAGGGSPTDTQNLPGGAGSAVGSTTGPAAGSSLAGGTSAAGAGSSGAGSSGSSGPPSGSTAHGAFPNGLEGAGEMGYRDSDGNWYDESGSPMSTEMAKKMEDAYQKGETVDYDSPSGDSESDGGGGSGGDDADAAPDPPPDNDSEDIEYTAADDAGPRPGTPGFERFQDLSTDYIAIRNQARADSTINPVREGYNDATGEEVYDESKSLTGPDGDTRYDSIATSSSGGSSAGQGYGNSSGSGAITYGPDSDVDFGIGPEDDVPIIDGPAEDLSHLADSITGHQDEPDSASSALPGGMSASDLKIEDGTPEGLDRAGIIRPVISEPVQYITGDLHSSSGSGGDPEPEPKPIDVMGKSARDSERPEMIRLMPADDEDDDSGQLAGKDIEIPVVDLDPGHSIDPRGATADLRGISAFDVFEKPNAGSFANIEMDSLPEVTEEHLDAIQRERGEDDGWDAKDTLEKAPERQANNPEYDSGTALDVFSEREVPIDRTALNLEHVDQAERLPEILDEGMHTIPEHPTSPLENVPVNLIEEQPLQESLISEPVLEFLDTSLPDATIDVEESARTELVFTTPEVASLPEVTPIQVAGVEKLPLSEPTELASVEIRTPTVDQVEQAGIASIQAGQEHNQIGDPFKIREELVSVLDDEDDISG